MDERRNNMDRQQPFFQWQQLWSGNNSFFGQSPTYPPAGQGGPANQPMAPPPPFTPEKQQIQTFAIDPGAIQACLYRFTYIWLRRGGFWFFPVFVGRRSISGYRWQRFRWVYTRSEERRVGKGGRSGCAR